MKRFIKRLVCRNRHNIIEQIKKLNVSDIFMDHYENEHNIYAGLKNILKPGWEKNFNREFTFALPGKKDIYSRKQSSMNKLNIMLSIMRKNNFNISGKKVLEIGCYGGTLSMMMKHKCNTLNTCSDITQYYIIQRGESVENGTIAEQNAYLKRIREAYMNAYGLNKKDIQFVNDDICDTCLDYGIYDMIFSFETLEHIKDPKTAFINMEKLLKPGGIMFHHYNPFFSIAGGHSYSTTNILWGHALLDSNDMACYFRQHETDIAERAIMFSKNNLNRMTLADLNSYTEHNFELLSLHKKGFFDYSAVLPVNAGHIIKNIYSTAEKDDLIYDEITVMMKKRD